MAVDDINRAIANVRARLVGSIDTSNENWNFWVTSYAKRYLQAHIRRALMFLDGGMHALDGGYGLVGKHSKRWESSLPWLGSGFFLNLQVDKLLRLRGDASHTTLILRGLNER